MSLNSYNKILKLDDKIASIADITDLEMFIKKLSEVYSFNKRKEHFKLYVTAKENAEKTIEKTIFFRGG